MKIKPPTTPSALHQYIQLAFVAFFVYTGWEFYNYYLWAVGVTEIFTPRPPAAEAFLPISALLAAKRLFLGGGFDPVHPAGLAIFLAAILIALTSRKSFCGFMCPVGWGCSRLDRLGRRLGISRQPGKLVSGLISLPKYILLGLLVWGTLVNMGLPQIEIFLFSPYNKVADSKMLLFFLEPTRNALVGLGVIFLGSLIVPGFWCRGFCPYGALLGLFSWLSPLAVRRDKQKCTYCRRCTRVCPVRIPVHEAGRVSSPECQGCLECVSACPEEGCLTLSVGYGKKTRPVPFWLLPLIGLVVLFLVWQSAQVSDNWQSKVPPMELKIYHKALRQIGH